MPRKEDKAYVTENNIFATRLRKIMKERKENQTTLAKKISSQYVTIQRQTISLYMNGQSKPDTDRLTAIAKVLDVSVDWLLGFSETKSPDSNVQQIREQTGLSEGIVKYLLNNRGYTQSDCFGGFAPVENFNQLFSPEDFHALLVTLCVYFAGIKAIKEIHKKAEDEIMALTGKETDDQVDFLCNKWFEKISTAHKEYRYERFELIDFFTKLLSDLEEKEDVQGSVEATKDLCTR